MHWCNCLTDYANTSIVYKYICGNLSYNSRLAFIKHSNKSTSCHKPCIRINYERVACGAVSPLGDLRRAPRQTLAARTGIWYAYHDDVMAWKPYPHYRRFVRGIQWSSVDFPWQKASNVELWSFLCYYYRKLLNKQSSWWWFELPWRSCNWRVMRIVVIRHSYWWHSYLHSTWMLHWYVSDEILKDMSQYNGVIMISLASQITSLTIVYSTVYSRADSKKTSKLCVTGLCVGNSPVTDEFPAQRASNAENISIWWHHNILTNTKQHETRIACTVASYRGHFSSKNSRTTPHSSPVRARYGVSFVKLLTEVYQSIFRAVK